MPCFRLLQVSSYFSVIVVSEVVSGGAHSERCIDITVDNSVMTWLNVDKIAKDIDKNPNSANGIKDITVMYQFIKGLDPTSVVRESEVGLMQQAISLYEKMKLGVQKIMDGRVLNPTLIAQVHEQMQAFFDIAKGELTKVQAGYIRRAGDVNARPDRVIDGDSYAPQGTAEVNGFFDEGSAKDSYIDSLSY